MNYLAILFYSVFLMLGLSPSGQAFAQSQSEDGELVQSAFIFGTEETLSADEIRVKEQFDRLDLSYALTARDLPPATVDPEAVRVMWWNIDCATSATKIRGQKSYKSNLEKNILDIINSDMRPNLLILGEYCPYYLSPEFAKTIFGKYKYNHHLVRNIPEFKTSSGKTNERNGIVVLSDYSLSPVIQEVLYADEKNKTNDKKNRSYLLLKVKNKFREFYLNPLHLYNPWRNFFSENGMFSTFFEIDSGTQNPNAQQGKQVIEKNMTYTAESDSLLIIGDLNSPKNFYKVDGYVYKMFNANYVSLIADTSDTFVSSSMFQSSAIDHAFAQNMNAVYGRVLPLAGSGHLPIYIIIQ